MVDPYPGLRYKVSYTNDTCRVCHVLIGHLTNISYGAMAVDLEGTHLHLCTICHTNVHTHCGRVVKSFFTCHDCCPKLLCACDFCGLQRARRLVTNFADMVENGKQKDHEKELRKHHH